VCIMKNYPDKYWNYLSAFNKNCYPLYSNGTALDLCWKNSAASAGINATKIETCVNADALALLKADEQAVSAYGVSGSPSLMINGAAYNGARTSDGYKSAICSAFNNPPAECSQNIGTAAQAASAAPSGGCG
ncbi:MAG: DsbA family protein, partial [Nanoarchaeota archaeon]|nr:DsbA family protein [Nanoarchaeota archaeon]